MKKLVKIKNSRGLNLAAVIHCPTEQSKCPCVLVLHGFLGNKEEAHMQAFCEDLANNGIVAIRFDASGFGESEGSVEKDFRVSNYLSDIEDVLDYAKSLSFVDTNLIGVAGHSLGGSLALIVTALHKEIKACCAIQACTKLTRPQGSIDVPKWQDTGWFEVQCSEPVERLVRLPYAMAQDADNMDALQYVSKIKVPTMILYGTDDIDVKPENILLLYEAAQNCPRELVELNGFDHHFKTDAAKLKIAVAYVTAFFQKYLLATQQEPVAM